MADTEEYEASLHRAFIDNKTDFIMLDEWSGRFLTDAAQHGLDKGWLTNEWYEEEQYSAHKLRLTSKGRKALQRRRVNTKN